MHLKELQSFSVAFFGGVDSAARLAAARYVLGNGIIAVSAASATRPSGEPEVAANVDRTLGVRHINIETDELDDPNFVPKQPRPLLLLQAAAILGDNRP